MDAGLLALRCGIFDRRVVRDAMGDATAEYEQIAVRWCSLETVGSRELNQAGAQRADVSHVVTMRTYEGLTPRHQLRIGERIFHVEAVTDDGGTTTTVAVKEEV